MEAGVERNPLPLAGLMFRQSSFCQTRLCSEKTGHISQWLLSPTFCLLQNHRVLFRCSHENLVMMLKQKPMGVQDLLWLYGISLIHVTLHSASKNPPTLPFQSFYWFMAPVASAQSKQTSALSLWMRLSPSFRMGQIKIIDFQFVPLIWQE